MTEAGELIMMILTQLGGWYWVMGCLRGGGWGGGRVFSDYIDHWP